MPLTHEWQAPAQVRGEGQNRGNSGIKFMSSFEIQILDSFNNRTYADGQAGAIYGQYPPMVNAARKPGEWQVYDILFIAPKFRLTASWNDLHPRPSCTTASLFKTQVSMQVLPEHMVRCTVR